MDMDEIPLHGEQPIALHRELGILFGFLAACILTVAVYYIFWQVSQRRAAARDDARRKDLRARGFHHERGGYHDKALNRYASRDPVARTQGQTLEFLTAPTQLQDMMGTGGEGSEDGITTVGHDNDIDIDNDNDHDTFVSASGSGEGDEARLHSQSATGSGTNSFEHHDVFKYEGAAGSNQTASSTIHTSTERSASDLF